MQAKTGNNEQTDRLAAYMQERLGTHRLPVDEVCWEEIEQRLEASAAPFRSYRRWGRALAAAALFGGLIGLFFLPDLRRPGQTAVVLEKGIEVDAGTQKHEAETHGLRERGHERAEGEKNERLETDRFASATPGGGTAGKRLASARRTAEAGPVSAGKAVEAGQASSAGGADTDAVQPSGAVSDSSAASVAPPVQPEAKKKAVVSGPEEAPGGRLAGISLEKHSATAAPRQWMLAVAGGAGVASAGGAASVGGGSGSQNGMVDDPTTGSDYQPLPPALVPDESFSPEDYSQADYALPLSFGVMARKNVSDRLAVESGLVYTYLSSRFAASGALSRRARLELHYLGVPLNLVVYAWNHPKWNVYFTAGGMVEKGLKSLYTQQVGREGEQAVLSRSEGIGGLQWSIHFSAGADYRFYKAWSVYLEPGLSRYFDNGQPASYRTAHRWSVGLTGGVRYEF